MRKFLAVGRLILSGISQLQSKHFHELTSSRMNFHFLLSLTCFAGLLTLPLCPRAEIDKVSSSGEYFLQQAARFEHGEGVIRNYAKAMELYCKAAVADNVDALYAMGWMFANGRGIAKDDGVASLLFGMAAERGHLHAQRLLSYMAPSPSPELPQCLKPAIVVTSAEDDASVESTIFSPKGPIVDLVKKLAPTYKIEPQFVLAVISVESGFNTKAVSSKNALGLMQLMPATASRFRVKNPFDSEDNIRGGMAYLRWLLAYFEGDIALVVAAYNSGERTVEKYRGIPPYPETQNYVRKIAKLYNKAVHPYEPSISKPSSVLKYLRTAALP